MAVMIPADCDESTLSQAEIDLFYALRSKLNSDWIVFHSFNICSKNLDNRIIDAEIDFLIFHPHYGILILEVKGGRLIFKDGVWYQNGERLKLAPDEQARLNKYSIKDYIKKYLNGEPPVTFGHAVCFPNYFGDLEKLPGSITNILISGQHLAFLDDVVINLLKNYDKGKMIPLDNVMERTIRKALNPIFEIGSSLIDVIGTEKKKIFRLTEKQIELLNLFNKHKKVLIKGCAGSGKTIMAVKKAKELAQKDLSVLVLCYNKMLSEVLKKELEPYKNHVRAITYHDFCIEEIEKANGSIDLSDTDDEFWNNKIPNMFYELLEKTPIKYDAVIVDEGQDFKDEYWISINGLISNDSFYYVFYDPDQNLFDTHMELPEEFSEPFILAVNCRSTKNIFNKHKNYSEYTYLDIDSSAPTGQEVAEFHEHDSFKRRKLLSRILHNLIADQNLKEEQIVILGGHSLKNTCLNGDSKVGQFTIAENSYPQNHVIPYYTFMKYKGLESDVIILLDVDLTDERWSKKSSLYTAMSRAKHLLYIIYSNSPNKN